MQALLSLLLLIALLWPGQFLLVAPPAAWAGASQKQLQEKQKKLERIRNLKKQVILKEKRVTTNILRNQKRIESTATSLKQKAEQLEQAKGGLTSLEKQLDVALGEQKKLSDEVGHRLRSFYMGEHLGMLDVLLDAANISTFMDRLYYQRRIYEQDKQLVKAYFARTKELQSKKEQLAWQKERLNSNIRAIQGYQKQLKESVLLDKLLVDKLKSSQRAYEAAEAQLQQESYRIQLQIQRSTKGIQGPVAGSTGQFMMPVNGPMTSNFGYRVHPVYRSRRFHSGQDFGVRRGTPIKAADGGTVIHAGWQGGYGKTVIINHGNIHGANLTTLYAHMSSISVHQGQSVSRGQIVGLVGSTGLSTGPHLHFEVRQNGKPVNPRNYLR